jgi:NAD(P)H-dependent FMN reductase
MHIAIVCGSVRENNASIKVSRFLGEITSSTGHTATVVDFTILPLPFLTIPTTPNKLHGAYPDKNVQAWSDIIQQSEAIVWVTPEYNHGYSPVIKNAIDWLKKEYAFKAVGLVGVSNGLGGGLRAIEQLRPIVGDLDMFDIGDTLTIRNVDTLFDETGNPIDEALPEKAKNFITQLVKVSEALRSLRS